MLFPGRVWPGLADGSITVAFRRWKRPSVKAGGTLQSPAGLLSIDELTRITEDEITEEDAAAAGYGSREDVLANLRPEGQLYRIGFSFIGKDPRIALRHRVDVDESVLVAVRRLPWAVDVLRLIAARPATVSTALAEQLGMERQPFKQRVRRLKSLGLTESLEVGYRLSPRGEAVLDRLDDGKTQSMASQTRTTTDHDEIRSWVEEHGGKPASVRGTESGDDPGVLRIDFPGGTGEDQLEHIDWEDWFAKFEESKLAFLYQEQKASGEDSTFFKLVNR